MRIKEHVCAKTDIFGTHWNVKCLMKSTILLMLLAERERERERERGGGGDGCDKDILHYEAHCVYITLNRSI